MKIEEICIILCLCLCHILCDIPPDFTEEEYVEYKNPFICETCPYFLCPYYIKY